MTIETLQRDAKTATKTVILIQDIADDEGFESAVRELVSAGDPAAHAPSAHAPSAHGQKSAPVQLEVLRCADAWIWDAYGSLMRSIVAQVACASGAVQVVVVGYDGTTASPQLAFRNKLSESPAAETAQYLMRHVLNVNPAEWFRTGDIRQRVKQTVQVVSDHPLLPDSVQVSGFVYNPAEGVCERI